MEPIAIIETVALIAKQIAELVALHNTLLDHPEITPEIRDAARAEREKALKDWKTTIGKDTE